MRPDEHAVSVRPWPAELLKRPADPDFPVMRKEDLDLSTFKLHGVGVSAQGLPCHMTTHTYTVMTTLIILKALILAKARLSFKIN